MPNVAQVLKQEIARVARRETRPAVRPIRKLTAHLRRDVAALKRQVAALAKETGFMRKTLDAVSAAQPAAVPAQMARARVTAKGLRSLRRSLRVSQDEFGKLAGVTGQAVGNWEKKQGPVRLREATKAAVLALRGIGARAAQRLLAEIKAKKAQAKKAPRRKGRRGRRRKA